MRQQVMTEIRLDLKVYHQDCNDLLKTVKYLARTIWKKWSSDHQKIACIQNWVYLIVSESFITKDFKLDFVQMIHFMQGVIECYRCRFIGEINAYFLNLSAFDKNDRYNAGLKFKMML